jgi:hypothetical protein
MKKASGFKMKNPSIAKMAKKAGNNRLSPTDKMMSLLPKPKINKLPLTKKPTQKLSKKPKNPVDQNSKKPFVRPPQPPKPGTIKGLTQFEYDTKGISIGNKYLGKLRGKVRDKIKDYFFTK